MTGAAELWTLSRVIAAGEALEGRAPARGTARRDASVVALRSFADRSSGSSPNASPRARCTARAAATVPRTQLTLADDTREGARVVPGAPTRASTSVREISSAPPRVAIPGTPPSSSR